jgi:hypothetical protein
MSGMVAAELERMPVGLVFILQSARSVAQTVTVRDKRKRMLKDIVK